MMTFLAWLLVIYLVGAIVAFNTASIYYKYDVGRINLSFSTFVGLLSWLGLIILLNVINDSDDWDIFKNTKVYKLWYRLESWLDTKYKSNEDE